jgi:hypothetical protein
MRTIFPIGNGESDAAPKLFPNISGHLGNENECNVKFPNGSGTMAKAESWLRFTNARAVTAFTGERGWTENLAAVLGTFPNIQRRKKPQTKQLVILRRTPAYQLFHLARRAMRWLRLNVFATSTFPPAAAFRC